MDRSLLTEEYIYSRLLNAILTGKLQSVVDFAYEIWQEPIKMIDPGYRFLAAAPSGKIGDRHWDVHAHSIYTPIELVTECYHNEYRKETLGGDGITYIDWGVDHPRLVGNVTVNKSVVAFISICYINNTPSEEQLEWDKRILHIFCKACAAVVMNDNNVGMLYKTEYDNQISMLFSGRIFSDEDKRYWESMSSIQLNPHFAVVVISVKQSSAYNLDYFKAMLRPISTVITYNFTDNFLYILICGINSSEEYATYCDNLTILLHELNFQAGGSQLFDDINQIPQQLRCALSAYDIAVKTHSSNAISVYDDVQADVILYPAVANLTKADFLHSCLPALLAYDKTYHTHYYHSLHVYIKSMCNTAIASERLFIHRNTLQYRLNKISEICGINLGDTELCCKLILSFMALDLSDRINT